MDRRVRDWAFASMGFTIAVAQGLLIRLLLVSFSGNELSIGLMLGNWMLAEALGSHLAGRWARRWRNALRAFALLQVAFVIALLIAIPAGYVVRGLAGAAPGEALGFAAIFWTSLALLAPLSALHGAMFSAGCAASAREAAHGQNVVGRLYILEALGAVCGGVALTFVLVPRLNPVQGGLLLAALGLATARVVMWSGGNLHRPRWLAFTGPALVACLLLLLSPQAVALHRGLVQRRWGSVYPIVYDRDSPYGNIAVARLLEQYTFLVNGVPILTTPFPDIAAVEEIVHLPLLFHPHPRRVLVLSGGLGGVLNELLKYPLESVDYAELDPLLIAAVRAFPTELTERELQDKRLSVYNVDGRWLLNQVQQPGEAIPYRYDLVLVNLPYPSTLELNRFYTKDFFQMVRKVLAPDGLAVFPAPSSLTYVGPGIRDLNLMLRDGLQAIFPRVRVIPGDTALWLASPSLALASTTLPQLVQTWQQRALPTRFVTDGYLAVRFDPQRLAWFEAALQTDRPIAANRDLRPTGVLYGLAYWSEIFAPSTYRLLAGIRRLGLWQWYFPVVLLTLAVALVARLLRRGRGLALTLAVATTGFSGMVCDLIVVFLFQTFYGYVYQHVGLIIAAFMAGLACGGWAVTHWPPAVRTGWRTLVRSEIALIAYWLLLPLLIARLAAATILSPVMPALLLLNAVGGYLVGVQFPVSSQLFMMLRGEASYTAGVLYAADLVGAFLGALAVGIALLPVLGTTGTCLFVVILKGCSLVLLSSATGP